MHQLVRTTALIFLGLTPVGLIAYYMGQTSIIDDGLEYFEPEFAGSIATHLQVDSLRCGPTIYVPAYSHIFWAEGRGALLSVTLSIRNTSPDSPLLLKAVDYYGTDGTLLNSHIDQAVVLEPLVTATILIKESDVVGGVGANFIVRTGTEDNAPAPIIESIMVGRTASGTISFGRSGLVIAKDCS